MLLGIYCRTSREQSVAGIETIEQQIEAGVNFAEKNHFEYQIYKDEGISGYLIEDEKDVFKNRPAFSKLLDDIKEDKITDVWVWEKSRLSRNNYTQAFIYKEFEKKKITLWENNRKFSFDNPADKLTMSILDAVAEFERFEIVARTSRGQRAAFDKGNNRHGSFYGYVTNEEKITAPNFAELEIVKKIYKLYLEENETLRGIGAKFFTKGNPETNKALSVMKKVRQILCHEEYTGQSLKIAGREIEKQFEAGELSNLQELTKDEYWVDSNFYKEKIITREQWISSREKIEYTRRRLAKGDTKRNRETETSLATGILKCGNCQCNFYYKDLKSKGGIVYRHLRTVEKCPQIPQSFSIRKLDTIIDVFYTFYYLLFDNTAEQIKAMKLNVKDNLETLSLKAKQIDSERNKKTKLISRLENEIVKGNLEDISALTSLISKATIEIKAFDEELKNIHFEIAELKSKETSLSLNEKYQAGTIERIQQWFELRERNDFKELRIRLRSILMDGSIFIGENIIEIITDDGRSFYFDINHDYKIILPFIEKIIDRKFNTSFSIVEEKWLEERKEKIETFGGKVKDFLLIRPDRLAEENFSGNDFLFLTDCFNVKWDYYGLSLMTNNEENLIENTVLTTEKAAELLNISISTLRWWAKKNNIHKTLYNDGHWRFYWTEKELELYRNSPHSHVGNKGYKFTPEQLEHLSKVRKGKKQSEASKQKKSEAMKKIWAELSPEEKEKRKSGLKSKAPKK